MWWMNEEREMIVAAAREFAQQEIRPVSKLMEEESKYPEEAIRKLGELGMLGLAISEEYGGAGIDYVNYGLMIEEFAKESHGFALLTSLQTELTIGMMEKMGTSSEQVKDWILKGVSGESLYGIVTTEPCGVFNVAEYETKAELVGDEWVINGGKILITADDIADAFVLFARTGEFDPKSMTGITCFLVPTNTKGVKVGHIEHKLGWKGSHTGQLYLDDVRIPKENVIGEVGNGWVPFSVALMPTYATYGAMNLGSMEAIYEKTLAFLKNRIQGGVSLWDAHETIRSEMARLWCKIDIYRGAVYTALENENKGIDMGFSAVALKVEGAELLEYVASQCIEFHGGTGTVYETGIERFYRDSKMGALGCGSNKTLITNIGSMM